MTNWSSPLVGTNAPIIGDMFVVATINGRRAFAGPISQYEFIKVKAHEFAAKTGHPIKLFCLSLREMYAFVGIEPAQHINNWSHATECDLRNLAIKTCLDVMNGSQDPREREDASETLGKLRNITSG